jgi:D-mannonate dehydratase
MSKTSRRGFVTSTLAAGAAALSVAPQPVLASSSNAAFQGGGKEKLKFVVEVGNIGSGNVDDAIQYAKDLGIQAISVPWERVPGFRENGSVDADRLKAIRAQVEQAGLVFHSMQASIPRGVLAGGAEAEAQFEALRRSFQAMSAARVDLLMAFAPVSRNASWDQVVGFYRRLMKDAEPSGVRIASHTLGTLMTYAAMNRLIQEVPSPNNGFCFCTGNVWHGEGEKIYDIPPQVASRFFFIHIRQVKTGLGEKPFWFDEGDIDFPKMLGALRKAGFRGYWRSEHLPTDNYGKPMASDVGTAWVQGYMRALQQLT